MDPVGGDSLFDRQIAIERHVPVLAMERNDISRLDQVEHRHQLVVASMSGNVDLRARPVDHFGPRVEELVDDAIDGRFVAWDRRRRDDDGIARADRDIAMVAVRDPAQHRHRLALAAGDDENDLVIGEERRFPCIDQELVGIVQVPELKRDFDVVFKTSAERGDPAAMAARRCR